MMQKERILIVDDEQDVADLLQYNIDKAGYKTIVARNGLEALETARLRSPELVLLDIMLPELDGWEVCRALRNSVQGKALPVIMLSALTDEETRVKGLAEGANDYITKPFSLKELLLKIRKCLDQERTIKSLRARERDHDTSLNYLVHELKNSVSVIGNFSALALRKEDDAKRYLNTIKSASLHAENLLNDASLLARIEQEGGSLSLSNVDLAAIAADTVDLFHAHASNREIELVFENRAVARISAHRTAVRQVLVNLLSNAIKYNRHGGRVWIAFDETDSRLDISVRDEGYGVSAAELPRIFEKFYRGAGSERLKGAGLGLYIVKLLTEAMGGKITATSTAGVGSVFTLSFRKFAPEAGENAVSEKDQNAPAVHPI